MEIEKSIDNKGSPWEYKVENTKKKKEVSHQVCYSQKLKVLRNLLNSRKSIPKLLMSHLLRH